MPARDSRPPGSPGPTPHAHTAPPSHPSSQPFLPSTFVPPQAISRSRFWGTPIPIWASDDGEEIVVVGSVQELQELTGEKVGGPC